MLLAALLCLGTVSAACTPAAETSLEPPTVRPSATAPQPVPDATAAAGDPLGAPRHTQPTVAAPLPSRRTRGERATEETTPDPPATEETYEPRTAPEAELAFLGKQVETLLPEIRLDADGQERLPTGAVARAMAVPGVTFATSLALGPVEATLPGRLEETLTVAAVALAGFRVLVPQETADEPAVWERVVAGGLVATHERADEVKTAPGALLATPAGDLRLEAVAALGQPPVADAMVHADLADDLGLGPPRTLLVSVEPEAWPDEVAVLLEEALGLTATLIYGKPQRTADLPAHTVWDQLARCESSGDWSINSGNGYYGGLQFLPSSWELVGGVGLPHEASREEQILRAELLLQRQGWSAWPVCSVRLGLREPGPGEAADGRPLRN